MGSLTAAGPLLALLGIFITAVLVMKKVPGALIIGIAVTAVLGIPLGVTVLPQSLTAAPKLSLASMKPDFTGLLALGPIPLISALLSLVVSQHFDVVGTLQGVAGDTKLMDTTGDVAGQKEAFLCCGAATCAGAMLGVVSYVVVMVCRKRAALVDPALYLLAAVFVLNAALGVLA